jgi:hypothetical protein
MIVSQQMKTSVPFTRMIGRKYCCRSMDKISSSETFFLWIETAEADGYILDHNQGIFAIDFFPKF